MKNKKFIMYLSIIFFISFIIIIGVVISKNNKKSGKDLIEEYTPLEEISEEQLRKTNITLYFFDTMTKKLATEIRQIDSKKLLENPEQILIEALINGPQSKSDNLEKLFPENTNLIDTKIINGVLYINFSNNIFSEEKIDEEKNNLLIESIDKTLSQLNEINEIKILINGEEVIVE